MCLDCRELYEYILVFPFVLSYYDKSSAVNICPSNVCSYEAWTRNLWFVLADVYL